MLADKSLLAHDAYDLPGVRTLAGMCGIKLGGQSSQQEIQKKLFPLWGTERAFIENVPALAESLSPAGSIPGPQVQNALLATGTLDAIPMRTVRKVSRPDGPVVFVFTGGVANWMQRRVEEGMRQIEAGVTPAAVYLLAGDRACDKDSELSNPYVRAFKAGRGRLPTEAELLPFMVKEITGYEREVKYNALTQLEQFGAMAAELKELAHAGIYVPVNANATYIALQARRAIRDAWPSFDADGNQFWLSQDGFPLAGTEEQAADTTNYQRPLTVFSGLVRLINELHLLRASA